MTVTAIPKQGYFVTLSQFRGRPGHQFCGEHSLGGAECPNCGKPLLQLLRLDVEDPRLELGGWNSTELPLLYCWTCNLAQDWFHYQCAGPNTVQVRHCLAGGVETDFPYEDYPRWFPASACELVPLEPGEQRILRAVNGDKMDRWLAEQRFPDLTRVRHQVGGEPLLVQPLEPGTPRCPDCSEVMPLLAAIGNECLDPRGIAGNDYVQMLFFACRRCSMVAACNRVD